ncbi:MAG: polysaccharide pyruvyl transferase family protein [Anaerolineales bacterium]|nr:polysaccharide pyruvyl transferase family protein [Anaerolineales bacterium]
MKTILIGGYYGAGNLGDEAILQALLRAFRARRNDLRFNVVSHDPKLTELQHQVQAVYWRDIPALAQVVQKADLVLLGGGGLFMDYWGVDVDSYYVPSHGGISTYGTLVGLAHGFQVPCMICGVGVGPLYSEVAREHTCRIFSEVQLASLRDEDSLLLLEEIGLNPLPGHVSQTSDLGFMLEATESDHELARLILHRLGLDPHAPLVGISIRYWDQGVPPSKWIPQLAESVRDILVNTRAQVLLLPFQIGTEGDISDDLRISRELRNAIELPEQTFILEEILSPGVMQTVMGQCQFVLGMRLHALVLAINNYVPVIGLAYDPKVISLMKMMGLEDYVTQLSTLPETLSKIIKKVWDERNALQGQIKKRQGLLKSLAQRNVDMALRLLEQAKPAGQVLPSFLIERFVQLQDLDNKLNAKAVQLKTVLYDLNEARSQATLLRQRLDEVETSRTYRIALVFQSLRNMLIPPKSRRETWLFGLISTLMRKR